MEKEVLLNVVKYLEGISDIFNSPETLAEIAKNGTLQMQVSNSSMFMADVLREYVEES
jgi:hypothetical protein